MKKVLILGVTGMLGHTIFKILSNAPNFLVYGTARTLKGIKRVFTNEELKRIRDDVEADNFDTVIRALASIQPDIVINCIGIIKQLPIATDPLTIITVNAQLPHRISLICRTAKARLIHISTDCVFNGQKGNYTEKDNADAYDLYGRTKYLGEVLYPHCTTIRTSIIGHEIKGKLGLVEWFLKQSSNVKGYINAIYNGLTAVEFAKILQKYILPNESIKGLYHISGPTISKYELLKILNTVYGKNIDIEPDSEVNINRTLNSNLFRDLTGYNPPSWEEMIKELYDFYISNEFYNTNFGEY